MPEAAAAAGVIEELRMLLPIARSMSPVLAPRPAGLHVQCIAAPHDHVETFRPVIVPRDRVDGIRAVAAPRDGVESISLQASRVVRVRGVVVQTVASRVRVDLVPRETSRIVGIRYETPPATPFGYPDRPLRRNSEEALRDRMPGTALIWDDLVRHLGRPARIHFAEAGHVIEARL